MTKIANYDREILDFSPYHVASLLFNLTDDSLEHYLTDAEYNNYYYRLYFKIDSYLSFEKIIYIIPIIILITLILLGLYSNFKTNKTFRADI